MQINKMVYIFVFTGLLLADQVSKHLALNYLSLIHFNEGIFLGNLSGSSQLFRVTFLATTSVYLCMLYLFLMDFLSSFFYKTKLYMTFIFSGVVGNIIDRVVFLKTIDFIPGINNTAFNVADIFITLGVILLIYELFRPAAEVKFKRSTFIINRKEQIGFASKMAVGSFLSSGALGIFTYTYVKDLDRQGILDYQSFIKYYIFLSILSTIVMFIIGLLMSHKTAGPIYAFERYILAIAKGEKRDFYLREGDNFQHLRETAEELRKLIQEKNNVK
ncbi:MAG: signal peptidase II [Bdellovibrionota bacterium]|nr:signal peptidase II [Bdellovibrionota bacterium]